jgi:hypothetical protein
MPNVGHMTSWACADTGYDATVGISHEQNTDFGFFSKKLLNLCVYFSKKESTANRLFPM